MKKLLRIILWIFLWVFFIGLLVILKWWMPWMGFEVLWDGLTEVYFSQGDYIFWKQKIQNNICSKQMWCLKWKVDWFVQKWSDLYVYINLDISPTYLTDDNWKTKIVNYNFILFDSQKYLSVKEEADIPEYWYLTSWLLTFYSENDLKNLPLEEQSIFEELKKSSN